MRVLALGALVAAFSATSPAIAQQPDSARTASGTVDSRLRAEIAFVRAIFGGVHAPAADSFTVGNRVVDAGTTREGTVAVARGNLEVRGRITGDAIALHGDVVVYPGGSVGRNAIAIDGRVRTMGGVVEGDVRSIRGVTGSLLSHAAGRPGTDEPLTTWAALKMVIGWFAVLFAIGIGVLLFAERNLDGVVGVLEQEFGRSFWVGVLTQLAAIPLLLLTVVALVITLLGILLIPFAVVLYVIAVAGLITLGFLAVARFTGRVFYRSAADSRAVHLKSLFVGLLIYLGLWFLSAAFLWNPVAASVLRAVALAGCWVAVTFGLGATILSRAGTRRDGRVKQTKPADDLSWQTPTPVTGVVAARRPVAAAKQG